MLNIRRTSNNFQKGYTYWLWDCLNPQKNNGARNIVEDALTDDEGYASIERQYKLAKKEGRLKIKEKKCG